MSFQIMPTLSEEEALVMGAVMNQGSISMHLQGERNSQESPHPIQAKQTDLNQNTQSNSVSTWETPEQEWSTVPV